LKFWPYDADGTSESGIIFGGCPPKSYLRKKLISKMGGLMTLFFHD
jgi:hypothetical protein